MCINLYNIKRCIVKVLFSLAPFRSVEGHGYVTNIDSPSDYICEVVLSILIMNDLAR